MRRRQEPAAASLGTGGPFREVEVPESVLERARRAEAVEPFAGVDLLEDYLRDAHGPEPHNREDGPLFRAYYDATGGRALSFLEEGLLAERPPF
ncbi:hypothetical protein [Nocardioides sp. GXQ0305]|uniref:hypothetical protein n=1 Tax=Nocardioides sp. GXQ0305 TaxID=3423912 RepID=UPI003D7CE83C